MRMNTIRMSLLITAIFVPASLFSVGITNEPTELMDNDGNFVTVEYLGCDFSENMHRVKLYWQACSKQTKGQLSNKWVEDGERFFLRQDIDGFYPFYFKKPWYKALHRKPWNRIKVYRKRKRE